LQVKKFEASNSPAYGGRGGMSLPRSLQRFSASRSTARPVSHTPQHPSQTPQHQHYPSQNQIPHTYTSPEYIEHLKRKNEKQRRKKKKKKKKKKRRYDEYEFLFHDDLKRNPESSRSRSVRSGRKRYVSDPVSFIGGGDMSDTLSDFDARSRRVGAPYYRPNRTVPVQRSSNKRTTHDRYSLSSSSSIEPIIEKDFDHTYDLLAEPEVKRSPKLSFESLKNQYASTKFSPTSAGGSDMIYPVTRSMSSDSDRTISSSFGKYKESLFKPPHIGSHERAHSKNVVGPSSRIPISPFTNSESDSEERKVEDIKRSNNRRRRRHRSSEREYRSDRHDRYSNKRGYEYRGRDDREERRPNRRQQRYMSDQLSAATFESYRERDYSSSSRRRQRRDRDNDRRGRQRESDISFERWRRRSDYRRADMRSDRSHRRRREPHGSVSNRRSARRSFEYLRKKYSFDDAYPPPSPVDTRRKRSPSPISSPTKGGGNFDSDDDRESLSPLRDKPPRFTEESDSISTLEDDTLRRRSLQLTDAIKDFGGDSMFSSP